MTTLSHRATVALNSPWWANVDMPAFPPLLEDLEADTCIVGAGICGLSIAYSLTKEGRSVVVLDDGPVGGGMTGCTSAHLSTLNDDRMLQIERWHGGNNARLVVSSYIAAINRIEQIVADEDIDCDFQRVDGYLFADEGADASIIDEELKACDRSGLLAYKIARAPLESYDTGPCLLVSRQAQFHPLKYLAGLTRAIKRLGGQIYTGTHADGIIGGKNAHLIATATGNRVEADSIVIATNTPINDLLAVHTKQAGYMTYVIGARIPRDSVPSALYWDTADPYHYVRTMNLSHEYDDQSDLLIVGGEDHKTGQADDTQQRYTRLETWARLRFPMITDIVFHWAGQVMESVDGLAYIGRNPMDHNNVYIVTGDSGTGLTHGTIAGFLIPDLIAGRDNPWTQLYSPSRKPIAAAAEFAREALNTAAQYTDWVTPGDVTDAHQIPPNCGAVIRSGLTKIAAYRDEAGTLYQFSATCPHLDGIVRWNHAQQTWDCPCHGSRFDKFGSVIMGPANSNLKPLGEK